MLALQPKIMDAVWAAVEPLIPVHVSPPHPLGCHRRRIPDRLCFRGIVIRLVTGSSWDVTARMVGVGETTLRRRFNQWIDAGVFDRLVEGVIDAYDRILGLDLTEVAVDGSQHKAPFGGEGTGRNPKDAGKQGWKWAVATDRQGIPIGWATTGADRHDVTLFGPVLCNVASRGLLIDVGTLHLDKAFDSRSVRGLSAQLGIDLNCPHRRLGIWADRPAPYAITHRWPVERTNSWLTNFGQLRRNTDRGIGQRLAQFALATTLIITIKLYKWALRTNLAT